jgi:apolipoprotein D and lipocalin family protein
MKKSFLLLLAGAFALLGCASIPAGLGPLKVVDTVNATRYLGRWYEVARFPHPFERTIVGATAEYSLRADGKIAVLNSGFDGSLTGPYTEVTAVARIPDPTAPARLKVTFFGLFDADYLIFGLDNENYSWALVGSDTRDFLWFLSRTPTVDDSLFARMKEIALSQGYKLEKLEKVPQKAR